MNKQLIVKCLNFYINTITENGKKCPTVEDMREIVQIDDIIKALSKKDA